MKPPTTKRIPILGDVLKEWVPTHVYSDAGMLTFPERGVKSGMSPYGHTWGAVWRNSGLGKIAKSSGINLTLESPMIKIEESHSQSSLRKLSSDYIPLSKVGYFSISYIPDEKVGNNTAELIAAINALQQLPEGWNGQFLCDNKITIGRLFGIDGKMYRFKECPKWVEDLAIIVRERLGNVKATLLDGHPNKEQLEVGKGKRGNPCSAYNVECDNLCRICANSYMKFYKEWEAGQLGSIDFDDE